MIIGVGVGLGLTGCSAGLPPGPDRDQSPTASPTPTPTPTPLPGTVDAVRRETELAAFAAAALHRFGSKLSTAQHHLLGRLHEAHLAHAAVLRQQDPTAVSPSTAATASPTPPASPTSSATPHSLGSSPKSALAKLRILESRAAKSYAELAASSHQPGLLALLWGSLAAAADSYATSCRSGADPGTEVVGDHRANVIIPDPTTAIADLLEQCYAIIFGYQSAIAVLSSVRTDLALDRLAGYRDLRDRLARLLDDQQAKVPQPRAAYRLPVQPTSAARAVRLVGIMEDRILPYVGQWLATSDEADRNDILAIMINTTSDGLDWSAKINVWPGYSPA